MQNFSPRRHRMSHATMLDISQTSNRYAWHRWQNPQQRAAAIEPHQVTALFYTECHRTGLLPSRLGMSTYGRLFNRCRLPPNCRRSVTSQLRSDSDPPDAIRNLLENEPPRTPTILRHGMQRGLHKAPAFGPLHAAYKCRGLARDLHSLVLSLCWHNDCPSGEAGPFALHRYVINTKAPKASTLLRVTPGH